MYKLYIHIDPCVCIYVYIRVLLFLFSVKKNSDSSIIMNSRGPQSSWKISLLLLSHVGFFFPCLYVCVHVYLMDYKLKVIFSKVDLWSFACGEEGPFLLRYFLLLSVINANDFINGLSRASQLVECQLWFPILCRLKSSSTVPMWTLKPKPLTCCAWSYSLLVLLLSFLSFYLPSQTPS